MCQEVKASAWKTAGVEERELFSGAQSLRVQGERRAFWVSLAMAPVTIGLIGLLFHSVTVSEFALLIVGGMAFVSISRGRLLGSSVRIDARQFPEVHVLVGQAASRLGIPAPHIFLRDDVFVPIAAVGIIGSLASLGWGLNSERPHVVLLPKVPTPEQSAIDRAPGLAGVIGAKGTSR